MALRLAFMGTPEFAVPTLAALLEHGQRVEVVYSQPPRPKGRGLGAAPSPVSRLAMLHGIEVRTPASLQSNQEQASLSERQLDALVVVAYGLLLPKPILDAPRIGCFNLHASLLPRWRGAAPIQRAIIEGDTETGVMVMRMEEGLDTGPIYSEERTPIGRKTFGQLHDELAELGAGLMVRTLAALERGNATGHSQHNVGATYAKKLRNSEARIDWSRPAIELDRLIRGLSPHPGAWCLHRDERLKVLDCDLIAGQGAPGTILDNQLAIACGEGALRLKRLQRAGRAPMEAAAFLRGYALGPGSGLS